MQGGIDSFRQLQAQLTTQIVGALKIPSSKAIAVQITLAAVMAIGATHSPQAQAGERNPENQEVIEYSPDWTGTKAKIGAGVGAVAGNLFGKFTETNRKATTAVGAVLGGVIGAVEGGRDKAAQEVQRFQQSVQRGPRNKLSAERDVKMSTLQLRGLESRAAYVEALTAAKDAEVDKSLMPNDKAAQKRYQEAVIVASKALREDRESTKAFTTAFQSMLGSYDVSEYSATYAKLTKPARIGDASYGQLTQYAASEMEKKSEALVEQRTMQASNAGRIENTLL